VRSWAWPIRRRGGAIAAVYASAHLASRPGADAVAKAAVLTAMIVVINATWLLVGASLAPVLNDARRSRIVNRGLAGALVAATILTVVG
jgi:threonine/homoserine/homoserine lactone efflux protein